MEVYLSTGRHTYPMVGVVLALQLPVYVGFFVLICYLHSKKRSHVMKKEARKQRPSVVELLPPEHDKDIVEGHTNQMVLEDDDEIESSYFPFYVTPL